MGGQVYLMVEQTVLEGIQQELKELRGLIAPRLQTQVEQSITHKEAAAFLNIDPDTLTRRIKKGVYPVSIVHVNGSRREYYKSELKALLK